MEKITVSEADVIATLRAVVAERPNYVYQKPAHMDDEYSCLYVHTDADDEEKRTPGCVVGHVLNRLGVPLDELEKREGKAAFRVVPDLADMPEGAVDALSRAQSSQDDSDTWSMALDYALTDLPPERR